MRMPNLGVEPFQVYVIAQSMGAITLEQFSQSPLFGLHLFFKCMMPDSLC